MTERGPIRVLLCDDTAVVLACLAAALPREGGVEVVGTAEGGKDAVAAAKVLKPDVVLMDLNVMRERSNVRAVAEIARRVRGARVLVGLTADRAADRGAAIEIPELARMLEAGACGYVSKQARAEAMVRAFEEAAAGELPECSEDLLWFGVFGDRGFSQTGERDAPSRARNEELAASRPAWRRERDEAWLAGLFGGSDEGTRVRAAWDDEGRRIS